MHLCFSISLKHCQSQSQTSHPHIKTSLEKGNSSCGKELSLVVSTPQTSQGSEWLPWAVHSSCTGTAHHVITADFPPSLCASPPVLPATLLETWEKVQGTWLWNKVWNPSSMRIHGVHSSMVRISPKTPILHIDQWNYIKFLGFCDVLNQLGTKG